MSSKCVAVPKACAVCRDSVPSAYSRSMPRARAWAPASAWNCGPWSPTSPISPSTSRRGAGSSASTSMAACMESGLAL